MAPKKKDQFGELPPKYKFVLNPYPDIRLSKCPFCNRRTGQRKLPLLIHVEPMHLIALNYTCRYCHACDLLIAHKHELEHLLTAMFLQNNPAVIGNDYLIMGTMEKKVWREGLKQPKSVAEMLPHVHDFKLVYQELRMTQPGWYPNEKEPPVMDPPPSDEWVKTKSRAGTKQHR